MSDDRVLTLRRNDPHTGLLTIVYCPPGRLVARTLVVPESEFLLACLELADEVAPANGKK
jgi:hypothetical protein